MPESRICLCGDYTAPTGCGVEDLEVIGSWALPEAHHLHRVAGQTLSVSCQYPPKGWPYERKGWCKELSAFKCTRLVTTSSPGRLVQASRFSIWDNPSAGLFIVTMTGLKEEDSGHYWCRIYHASSNSVSKSIRFYLAVSPVPASTQAIGASGKLVSSPTQSSVPPTGRAREAPRASSALTAPSQQQNSTLQSHPTAPSAMVPVLCALLVAKSLVLSALLVRKDPFSFSPTGSVNLENVLRVSVPNLLQQ
ncbi:natural cytotoxicity triggering receptor 2 [Ursus arctos]|uniref:natural cytotoxicity triggering receptor 2 n=1 Tax=Ursus arctos TaxID=9644 RepID=UPI002017CFE2|nr:natural cytotoxicity triggering receptor 2 [Ursus arctos]